MKKSSIIFIFIICTIFLSFQQALLNNTNKNIQAESSQAFPAEVLVFNGVLSYPSILNNDRKLINLDENYITPNELIKILKSLYKNNYIIVKLSDIIDIKACKLNTLNLPPNKKPVVLMINNVAYGQSGEVNKLIIERNDKLASYTSKQAINKRINYDKEFITIVENFISSHPDFSYKGAKGMAIISGSKGIFGYKTQKTNANSKFQIKKCAEIIDYLNSNGWEFCATSYSGESCNVSNLDFASSINKWINYVKPFLTDTPFYFLNESVENLSDFDYKAELLRNSDFKVLLSTDMEYYSNKPEIYNEGIILGVKKICGDTLRSNRNDFLNMFDSEILYDRLNRSVPF